ncbi:tripartite tricarboxylate transporter permease [Methanimicrococcus sp. OttesenSCG-928-J09]|nr:tripartite tricarboxylate transporter permease [Methanimicrococcus sp. OttesenSCG-928-J09]
MSFKKSGVMISTHLFSIFDSFGSFDSFSNFSSTLSLDIFGPLLFCVAVGWIFGLLTGMIPGIHVNNIAVILASTTSFFYALGLSPILLSAVILSCAISHTFHNIIPAIFLGAPGEDTVFAVLPGHKLLIAGEGLSAVRLSALSSAASVFISTLLLIPAAWLLFRFYPVLLPYMGWILLALTLIVLLSEIKTSKIVCAAFVFLTAGFLGLFAFGMDGTLNPVLAVSSASVLMPLLSGLFGVPQLIISLFSDSKIPDVSETKETFSKKLFIQNAFLGTAAGAFVSWIPGVSSSVAAILAGLFKKNPNDEAESRSNPNSEISMNAEIESKIQIESETTRAKEFIVIVSAINTANAVFGLLAFFVIGKSRNGAVVSIQELLSAAGIDVSGGLFTGGAAGDTVGSAVGGTVGSAGAIELFILFYAVVVLSAFLSYYSTIKTGKYVPILFKKINYRVISGFILIFLTVLIYFMCGSFGLILFAAAVLIGFLPVVLHVKKSNLMGVILFPVMLYFLGLH